MTKDKALKRIISGMLKENTGRHLCDSGGAYGRHWEKNQKREFEKEPVFSVDISEEYKKISITHNLFWFLVNYLEQDYDTRNMERRLKRLSNKHPNDSWLSIIDTFAENLCKKDPSIENLGVTYAYNSPEHCLSQDIQYLGFRDNGYDCVILQVHGGCDARTGLGTPRIFKTDLDYFTTASSEVLAWCPFCKKHWTSYNGGYIYDADNDEGDFLEEMEIKSDKVICKSCNNPILFGVPQGY